MHDKRIGLGQTIQPGEKLARLYSTDSAEIRLPLATDQLGFLDLPIGQSQRHGQATPRVVLSAEFSGSMRHWQGNIIRTEGALDETTGLLHAVAEVREPYVQKNGQPPLLAGLFVQAEIDGLERQGLFVLPAGAVNSTDEALLVDANDRLHIRRLDILRHEPERALVKGGLKAGDRVIVSGIQTPVPE